jgi:3-oxoacyl-[acyl-carrier protein] reductase
MNILITGVSKGLGLNIAKNSLEKGFSVYGISRSKNIHIENLLSKYPNNFFWKSIDLSDKSVDIKKDIFIDFLSNKIEINGFINNAAVAYDDIITNADESKLNSMFRLNTIIPILLTKYVIRNMIFNKVKGSIVHISSISVHTGYKGLSMYAASKGSLEAFSKNTAREWGERGIRSNCIVAGFMETDMSLKLTNEQKQRIYNRTSLKSDTSLDSVSNTCLYLIRDESKSITGTNIFVDSGTI